MAAAWWELSCVTCFLLLQAVQQSGFLWCPGFGPDQQRWSSSTCNRRNTFHLPGWKLPALDTKWRCFTFWCDVTRWSKIGALKYRIDLGSGKQRQKLNHLLSSPLYRFSFTPSLLTHSPALSGSERMGNGNSQTPHLLDSVFPFLTHTYCSTTVLTAGLSCSLSDSIGTVCVQHGAAPASPHSNHPCSPQCQHLDS